jgi:hypothetical protein
MDDDEAFPLPAKIYLVPRSPAVGPGHVYRWRSDEIARYGDLTGGPGN